MAIELKDIGATYSAQVEYFKSGATLPYSFRKQALKRFRTVVRAHESSILDALKSDLNKPDFEAYSSEVGLLYKEIRHTLHELKDWMRPERVPTSFAHFPTRTHIHPTPKGHVLILSPWNYPFMLLLNPMVAAVAAGNTVLLKLPWQTPATAAVIEQVIAKAFAPEHVACIRIADEDIIPKLIQPRKWDHIFFTGSPRVGKLIMAAAAEQLTPVTLELGGKSPAIVDGTGNLATVARKLIWAKGFNAGQTCIAPDHIWVQRNAKAELMHHLERELMDAMQHRGGLNGFPRIIHTRHFESLLRLLEGQDGRISGGELDADNLKLGLTLVDEPSMEDPIMQQEIFGPILPVLTYVGEADLIAKLDKNPYPLAFYYFGKQKRLSDKLMRQRRFGGGCINNALIHFSSENAAIGGVGTSGIGAYHGRRGFDELSHPKTIMKTGTWLDIPLRYPPYAAWKMKILRLLFR